MNRILFPRILFVSLLLTLLIGCRSTVAPRIPEVLAQIAFDPGHPVEVASNPRTDYVYITNRYSNHVGVLRGLEQVATLQTGGEGANALAVDEERGWVYVVNEYADSVSVIRETAVLTTLETAGRNPQGVAVAPQSGWAYVVSGYSKSPPRGEIPVVAGNVTVISGTQIIDVVLLGDMLTTRVAADPVSGNIYVGGGVGDAVTGITGRLVVVKDLNVLRQFDVEAPARAIDANPRTGDVYVLDVNANLLQVRGTEIVQQVNFWEESGSPRNMRVHPTTGDVYITYGCGLLVVRNMEVIGNLPIGCDGQKMVIDPLTGNVYVANFSDNTVAVVQGIELLATIDVGWYPYGIGVNPANGWIYVSNSNDSTVTILGFSND